MASINKLLQLHRIFDGRRTPIPVSTLADRLECSEKTIRRYIDLLRDELDAPLISAPNGYFYDRSALENWQIPGMWMTREESQSLLLFLDMLNRFGNGLLSDELRSVHRRVDTILERRGVSRTELENRIHIVPVGQRAMPDQRLQQVLNALVDRKRMAIRYRDFSQNVTKRTISPQRLVYYRDNWYVEAWCHSRRGLQIFSLARVEFAATKTEDAIELKKRMLDRYFDSAYGVFAGEPGKRATLRFFPAVAHEIAAQTWHPAQQGWWENDDFILSIPYSESTELLQDILKHLPNVRVDDPPELRAELQQILAESIEAAQKTG